METDIREITERDQSAVLAVAEAIPQWFDADARTRAIPIDLRHHHGYLASSADEIIGFITLFVFEGRLNISWMGVKPAYHRHGVGGKLLAQAEQYGRRLGLSEIATYTLGDSVDYEPYEATRQFYCSHGFSIHQRNRTDNPGCPEEIRLKKTLV